MATQGHVFWGQWKGDMGLILHNNVGLISYKVPKTQRPKSTFFITPLSFDAPSPWNPRELPHKPYIARIYSHCATSSSLTVQSIFVQILVVASETRTCFETQCVMALQSHPRSLTLAPIESEYATSYYSSIVTLVYEVFAPFQRYCRIPTENDSVPIPPEFQGNLRYL